MNEKQPLRAGGYLDHRRSSAAPAAAEGRWVGGQVDQEEGIADVLGCFLQPGILEAGIPGGGRRMFPALGFRPDGEAAGAADLRP